jgi:hypothetical protein
VEDVAKVGAEADCIGKLVVDVVAAKVNDVAGVDDRARNFFRSLRPTVTNQRMQVNKMGGEALDEEASTAPILCLILIVRPLAARLGLR